MATSAVIGTLRVSLGIDSAQFSKGLKGARSGLDKLASQAKVAFAALSTAAAGAFYAITQAAQRADKAWKTSQRLGLPIEEYQRLAHAAEMSGVATNTFDMALQRFTRRAAEAANGTGEAEEALDQLGIRLRDANGAIRPVEEMFHDVADALMAVENPAERVRIAFKLFDSEGVKLITMLQGGSAALKQYGDEAERLGLVISEKTARASERFNDNMSLLSKSLTGLWNKVLASVAPAFETLAFRMMEAMHSGGSLNSIAATIAGTMNVLARGILVVFDNLHHLYDLFKIFVAAKIVTFLTAAAGGFISLARAIRVAGLASVAFTTITRAKITALALAAGVIAKLTGTYDDMVGFLKNLGSQVMSALPATVREGVGKIGESIRGLADDIDIVDSSVTNSMRTYLNAADAAAASFGQLGDKTKSGADSASSAMKKMASDAQRVFEQTRTPLEQYQMQIARLNELLQAGAISQDTYNRAVAQAQDEFDKASKGAESNMLSLESVGKSLGQTIGSAFSGLIDGSRKLKDVLKDLLSQLTSMLANQAFQYLLGGAFGGGGGGFFGNILKGLRGFANGGQFQVGGAGGVDSQIVAFRASPNETVDVRKPGQDMGGGGAVQVSVKGVFVDDNGVIKAQVTDMGAQAAKAGATAAVKQVNQSMPNLMAEAQSREL